MSGPPLASSWAAPPEFFLDENIAGRTLARGLRDLGYRVHTPAELYGGRDLSEGVRDEEWLADVGSRGWVAITRDAKILQRPAELAAYRAARIHLFLFPGQVTREELVVALNECLRDMCAYCARARPGIWRVHRARGGWGMSEL